MEPLRSHINFFNHPYLCNYQGNRIQLFKLYGFAI